jgi:hypothetical protein
MEAVDEPEIVLLILDAGGASRCGQRAGEAARREGCPWRFRIVSLQEVFALDLGRRLTGRPLKRPTTGWSGGGPCSRPRHCAVFSG